MHVPKCTDDRFNLAELRRAADRVLWDVEHDVPQETSALVPRV